MIHLASRYLSISFAFLLALLCFALPNVGTYNNTNNNNILVQTAAAVIVLVVCYYCYFKSSNAIMAFVCV